MRGVGMLQFKCSLLFPAVPELMTRLRLVEIRSHARAIIIDFMHCLHCDYTGVKVCRRIACVGTFLYLKFLEEFVDEMSEKGVHVYAVGANKAATAVSRGWGAVCTLIHMH